MTCPACNRENDKHAVFCVHCSKALGAFRYIREEFAARSTWHERLADRATAFIGRPHFFVVHLAWFVVWVVLNTGLVMVVRQFDAYPFGLLGILLSCEAIFITGFLLISQNREKAWDTQRAELDYETNVQTYREIGELKALLQRIDTRLAYLEEHYEQ